MHTALNQMSANFIKKIFSAILFLSSICISDISLVSSQQLKSSEELQYILNIPLQSLFAYPESQTNVTRESAIVSQNCSSAFEHFTDSVVNFTRCSIRFARPIHICLECQSDYNASVKAYQDLKKQGTECNAFFFSSDQLGIVDVIYNGAKNLWEKSFCKNCFDYYNETLTFMESSTELLECMNNSNKSVFMDKNSTCEKCHLVYANLSESYNNFVNWKKEFSGGICMDIVDTMNISRRLWTENKCAIEFETLIGFANVLTALTVGATPVMFYLLAKNISRLEDVKLVVPKRKFTNQAAPEQ